MKCDFNTKFNNVICMKSSKLCIFDLTACLIWTSLIFSLVCVCSRNVLISSVEWPQADKGCTSGRQECVAFPSLSYLSLNSSAPRRAAGEGELAVSLPGPAGTDSLHLGLRWQLSRPSPCGINLGRHAGEFERVRIPSAGSVPGSPTQNFSRDQGEADSPGRPQTESAGQETVPGIVWVQQAVAQVRVTRRPRSTAFPRGAARSPPVRKQR